MKVHFYYPLLCVVFLFSCKKESQTIQPEQSSVVKSVVKLENDYLHFENYESFVSTLQNLSTLSESDRLRWEKSLKFKSISTIYDQFNKELTALEGKSEQEYFKGYIDLKENYKKQLLFTENAYSLNTSGVFESYLANKDGIVKVGDEFLHFTRDGIETIKNSSYEELLIKMNDPSWSKGPKLEGIQINATSSSHSNNATMLVGYKSAPNSFRVESSPFTQQFSSNGRGVFNIRAKIYNINNASLGSRAFVSLECYSQHKNVFGTFRDVKSIVGISGDVAVYLYRSNGTVDLPFSAVKRVNISGTGTDDGSLDDRYEFVVVASDVLKNNPALIQPYVGTYVKFGPSAKSIDDSEIQPGGFWTSVVAATGFATPETLLRVKANSLAGAPLGAPSEDFAQFQLTF